MARNSRHVSIANRSKMTPPELARLWGVSPDKVTGWIRSGELSAIDASTKLGGRPRYLIDQGAIAAFERRRAVVPTLKYQRKNRHKNRDNDDISEFY